MFKKLPQNLKSISHRKLRYGVGINDAVYMPAITINNKVYHCPIFQIWTTMLKRCYSEKSIQISYVNCIVCDGWLIFSNFEKWVKTQNWKNKELDKDILISGNKIYSPNTCMFVTKDINSLLTIPKSIKGKCPVGVSKTRAIKGYQVFCNIAGKGKNLGSYTTIEEAEQVYLNFKSEHVNKIALQQSNLQLQTALIRISKEILNGQYY